MCMAKLYTLSEALISVAVGATPCSKRFNNVMQWNIDVSQGHVAKWASRVTDSLFCPTSP